MLTLDTHIVVALLNGELTEREGELVAGDSLGVSDVVLWELSKLVDLGRLELDFEDVEFRTFLRSVTILPITIEIARRSTALDFASDPADEIIAATAIITEAVPTAMTRAYERMWPSVETSSVAPRMPSTTTRIGKSTRTASTAGVKNAPGNTSTAARMASTTSATMSSVAPGPIASRLP